MDKYVIYVNGDATDKEFPYTVKGFMDALREAANRQLVQYRLDYVHVVNPNRVDLGCPYGLLNDEIDIAGALCYEDHV